VGNATALLDGQWQFHTGDNLAWASPDLDDSGWGAIGVDKSWGAQGHFGYTGYAWYRRHLTLTPVAGAKTDLALFFPPVDDAYEVYWNGKLIGKSGNLPPHPVWYFDSPYRTFEIGPPQSGVLAVRVWKAGYASFDSGVLGGFSQPPRLGSSEAIAAHKEGLDHQWLRSRQYDFGLDLLYGLVALLSFLAWLRSRSQKLLFWMGVYAAEPLLVQGLISFRIPFSYLFSLGVLQPLLGIGDIALWFLLLYLLQLEDHPLLSRWTRILAIIAIVSTTLDGCLTLWAFDASSFPIPDAILTAIFSLLEAFPLVLIAFALRKRLDASRWFVAILAFTRDFIVILRATLDQGQRFTHWTFGDKIEAPLFTINGSSFNVLSVVSTLLFVAIVYAVYRYTIEQSRRQGILEQEFKSAQELQRVLIPETLPSVQGYSVTSAYRPAEDVGGDFFQLIPQPSGSTIFVLGDVSGKGLKAAMTVSMIVGAARTLAEISDDPAQILSGLNRRLFGRVQDGFATCLVMRLDPEGECVLANAGHPSPFLNQQELMLPGELPLGLLPAANYKTTVVHLDVADRLTLYTDGLLEARNAAGELFSFERLQQLIATQPDARQASEAAVAFGQDDDITVLTVTRLATGVESTTLLLAPALVSTSG
jgi:Stage II sporulation protein E (SpoIIE)